MSEEPTPDELTPHEQVAVIGTRPVKIALHPIKDLEEGVWGVVGWHSLTELAEILNARQQVFAYTATVELTPPKELSEKHGYQKEDYFSCLADQIEHTDFDAAIGITHWDLEESQFNQHAAPRRVGVVTTSAFEAYLPPGGSLLKYLAYLILCESFCLATGQELEHDKRNYCLFDACTVRRDLVRCLRKPHIDTDCCAKLAALGFPAAEQNGVAGLLDFVGATSWWHFAAEAVREPGTGFLLGVGTAFAGAILATVSVAAAIAVLGVVTTGWLGLVTYRYRDTQWRRRQK